MPPQTLTSLDVKSSKMSANPNPVKLRFGVTRAPISLPDRSKVRKVWTELVEKLGELPKKMTDTELQSARTAIKGLVGEIRVTRDSQGYADVCLQSMVAGA